MGNLSLAALYGETEYGNDSERELNVIAGYEIIENLTAEALVVDVDAEASTDDYTKFQFMISYAF